MLNEELEILLGLVSTSDRTCAGGSDQSSLVQWFERVSSTDLKDLDSRFESTFSQIGLNDADIHLMNTNIDQNTQPALELRAVQVPNLLPQFVGQPTSPLDLLRQPALVDDCCHQLQTHASFVYSVPDRLAVLNGDEEFGIVLDDTPLPRAVTDDRLLPDQEVLQQRSSSLQRQLTAKQSQIRAKLAELRIAQHELLLAAANNNQAHHQLGKKSTAPAPTNPASQPLMQSVSISQP